MERALTATLPEEAALPGRAEWIGALRRRGRALFGAGELPGPQAERWLYARRHLQALISVPFCVPPARNPAAETAPPQHRGLDLPEALTFRLVDGRLVDAPPPQDLPLGLSASSLAALLDRAPEAAEGWLGRILPLEDSPFAALNTSLLLDGLVIRVAAGTRIERPLHLVSTTSEGAGPGMAAPRLLAVLDEGASLTLAESHGDAGGGTALTVPASELFVGRNAELTHVICQEGEEGRFHYAAAQAEIAAGGRYRRFSLALGAAASHDDFGATLKGEGAEACLDGIYAVAGKGCRETASLIDHAVPGCLSTQTCKGLVDEAGQGVFQGKIHIRPGAGRSSGRQLHKALLLSRQATVNAKPELTIFADDVVCSHGATTGDLDEAALFHLRARGVSEAEAKALLIEGFFADLLAGVARDDCRDALRSRIAQWLQRRSQGRDVRHGR